LQAKSDRAFREGLPVEIGVAQDRIEYPVWGVERGDHPKVAHVLVMCPTIAEIDLDQR
jgi:hypothetical protein